MKVCFRWIVLLAALCLVPLASTASDDVVGHEEVVAASLELSENEAVETAAADPAAAVDQGVATESTTLGNAIEPTWATTTVPMLKKPDTSVWVCLPEDPDYCESSAQCPGSSTCNVFFCCV